MHVKMQCFYSYWFDDYDFCSDCATFKNDTPHSHQKTMTDCYPSDIPKASQQFTIERATAPEIAQRVSLH